MSDIFNDFKNRRESGNQLIEGRNFLPFNRFYNLDTMAYKDGALNQKTKELMGLSCSLLLRCNDCVLYHLEKCIEMNATNEELDETMNIALVIGGSIVIPHLRYAYAALDELRKLK